MTTRSLIAICILSFFVTAANAQSPRHGGFFGGRGQLLVDLPEVRRELGVDAAQAELLDALQEDLADQRRVIREEDENARSLDEDAERSRFQQRLAKLHAFDHRSETLLSVVLEPQQANRLSELYLHRDGLRALERPEVVTKLRLSDEQKARLQSLRETLVENRPRKLDVKDLQTNLREKEEAALHELLSEEQQTLWQQLLGKPFDFPAR